MPSASIAQLISVHGYWIVAVVVGLESMAIPLPGETVLITAAIYAGTTGRLNIGLVIAAAATGAIVGDNIGFWLGSRFGSHLLHRYGPLLRLDSRRIRLGQYLFERHGGKVVFFGRFVAVLRALAALLAGVNQMDWWRFFFFNATGGIVWAAGFGMLAYSFGEQVEQLHGRVAIAGAVVALAGAAFAMWFARRHEATLFAEAERHQPKHPERH